MSLQAWHSILVPKIQELQEIRWKNTGHFSKKYRRLKQDNFQSSQNTGGNCHFTGNTGITGVRATPGGDMTEFDKADKVQSKRVTFQTTRASWKVM